MTIVVYTAPAVEPVSIAEALAHCRVDASNQEPAPGAVTAVLITAAGNVNTGVHRYLATFTTAAGETQAGAVSAAVTADAGHGQVALSGIPLGGASVTGRKLYRTTAGGSTYLLLASIADNTTTTYTDNIADASLGAQAPSTNTTADPEWSRLIKAARLDAEKELGRYLITQTLDAYFDNFPRGENERLTEYVSRYEFMLPPLQSVESIAYVDTAGVTQTLAVNQYLVDAKTIPARIAPAYGVSWPSARQQNNAVTVRFIGGYGDASSAVPDVIRQWLLLRIDAIRPGGVEMPEYANGLLDAERVWSRL